LQACFSAALAAIAAAATLLLMLLLRILRRALLAREVEVQRQEILQGSVGLPRQLPSVWQARRKHVSDGQQALAELP